jgi:uncharacterized protein (TIGR00369 family)
LTQVDDVIPEPPAGFRVSSHRGPFTNHNGPYFHRVCDAGAEQAFFALSRHCNGFGIVHGGMIAAFLDGLLAGAAARAAGGRLVTMQLSVSFLDMGRAGDWVLGDARATKVTRDLAFVEGRARVGDRDIARATGVFKLMRPRAG